MSYAVRKLLRSVAVAALWFVAMIAAAPAQQNTAVPPPSWVIADLLPAARAEGGLTIYSSINEEEGLPLWKLFEDATGIKVTYVRASDSALLARIAIEGRAQRPSWDVFVSTAVSKLPPAFLQPSDPPEAANIMPLGRDPGRRWFGMSPNYNTPAYNTKFVKPADLPATYEGFLAHPEWKGKVAFEGTDAQWLSALFDYYGEDRARRLVTDIVAKLDPVMIDGHLALARDVGAGEYWIALNNYDSLTLNVALSGAPTDVFALDPVALFFIQVGISVRAPHPKAALLAANFLLSREAQQFSADKAGRAPARADVTPNPPGMLKKLGAAKIVATHFLADDEKKWQKTFQDLFRPK